MTEVTGFGFNPGSLRMLSHAPADLPPMAPLVVVLHGCTQTAEAFAAGSGWLALADRHGFAVLAPEQVQANNPNRCFNWFAPDDVERGRGEAASIVAMVGHAIARHGLDPSRVFVTGLSAGGAMTLAMLASYPDVFAAGAVVAGLPFGVARNVQEAMRAMHRADGRGGAALGDLVRNAGPPGTRTPRLAIWHGDADTVVSASNARDIAAQVGVGARPGGQADETRRLPGRIQSLWRSQTDGEVLIESNLVRGLGHGTPLATRAPDAVGTVAPFMLEAGVASSLEIARFWGLAEAADPSGIEVELAAPSPEAPPSAGIGHQVMGSLAGHVPEGVQDVIAGALRKAGLMR